MPSKSIRNKNKITKHNKTSKHNKTFKQNKTNNSNYSPKNILINFLELLNAIKLYHWKTMKYSEHKATDELYSELSDKIDNFIEVLMGKDGQRINLVGKKTLTLHDFTTSSNLKNYIEKNKLYFERMNYNSNTQNTDLLNIRDEILGLLNKFSYLSTLK
jgi:DNA-binding ferritin-like protein